MKIAVSLFSHYQRYFGVLAFLDLNRMDGTAFVVPGQVCATSTYAPNKKNYHGINGFHGMDYLDGYVYCCQWSRIIVFSTDSQWPVRSIYVDRVIQNKDFNDLHDLQIKNGKLYVAASGSETGFVLGLEGDEKKRFVFNEREDVRHWLTHTGRTFDTIAATKPHPLHLNTFIQYEDYYYATILNTGMVMRGKDETSMEPYITGLSFPHDCFLIPGYGALAVTNASTGELHGYSISNKKPSLMFNIQLPKHPDNTCWTRGVAQVGENHLLIGLSVHRSSPETFLPGIALVNLAEERVETIFQFDIDLSKAFASTPPPGMLSRFNSYTCKVMQVSPEKRNRLKNGSIIDRVFNLVRDKRFRNINIYSLTVL